MNAKRCDHCGLIQNNNNCLYDFEGWGKITWEICIKGAWRTPSNVNQYTLDLCPSCLTEFRKFVGVYENKESEDDIL